MKREDLAGILFAVVAAAAAAYFLIGNSMKAVTKLVGEQRQLTQDVEFLTELTSALGQAEGILTDLQAEAAKLDEHLPDAMGAEDFYLLLADIAARSRVTITDMEPAKPVQGEGFTEMPLTVSATATFPRIHRFLFTLGDLPRLTKVDYLLIEVQEVPDVCHLEMVLKIYAKRKGAARHGV